MADTANQKGKSKAKATDKPTDNSPKTKKDNQSGNPKETAAPKSNPKETQKPQEKATGKAETAQQPPSQTKVEAAPVAEVTAPNDTADTTTAPPAKESQQTGNQKGDQKEKKEPKPKATGKGSVKSVSSGDTFVIINLNKGQQGPPSELTMSLSNISAPGMGRRGGKKDDSKEESKEEKEEVEETENKDGKRQTPATEQAYAWEAREFLRKLIIGQQISYVIEATAPPPSNKAYGVVYMSNGDNVAARVVQAGFASVREPKGNSGTWPELDTLINLNNEAKSAQRGMYAKDSSSKSARKLPKISDNTYSELYERLKGKPQSAVVEQVITGSTLRVMLLPSFHEVVLILSGVEAPMINLKQKINKPFSREAKFYTEYKVLNRDVEIFLEGADRQNLYGSVVYKDAGDRQGHLNMELLAQGLGTFVEWSGARTGQFADKLRAAEKEAKSKQLRVWTDYTAPKGLSKDDKKILKPGREILGKVTEIVNSTCIMVVDAKSMDHKVWLSSVRPKKPQPRTEKTGEGEKVEKDRNFKNKDEDPAAAEAKEMLRKRLIGQKVRCVFDYTQPALQATADDRDSYSVYLEKNNVAVELVEAGLIVAAQHRGGEPRSKDYELLLFAEGRAIKAGKGQHATGDRKLKSQMQDVREVAVAKAKFPSLERAGKIRGVVDYEFSATKIKLLVPKETCKIVLALAGVTTGTRAGVEPTKEQKDLAAEALFFVKEKIHQHDVEFQVSGLDRSHTFIGDVWVGKQNLAAMLLEQGFVKTFRTEDRELTSAEDLAKRNRRRVWKDYDPEAEKAERAEKKAKNEAKRAKERQLIDIVVTEIVNGGHFYAQIVGEQGNSAENKTEATETPAAEKENSGKEQTGRGKKKVNYKEEISQLEDLMKQLSEDEVGDSYIPRGNEIVKAQFTEDDAWYRAKVLAVDKNSQQVTVQYIDYGNSEKMPMSRVRQLKPEFNTTKLRPQAYECFLSSVTVPDLEDDFGREAAEFFKELVWGKTITANIDSRGKDNETLYVSLATENNMHVNAAMLHNGLARCSVGPYDESELAKTLREEEKKARSEHAGIWRYGDPYGDDDDDDRPRRGGRN